MTFQEIVDQARSARAKLVAIVESIEARIRKIEDKEFERPLTQEERDQLAQLRRDMDKPMAAVEELGLITMAALDNSDEVRRLANTIADVRNGLDGNREHLAGIAEGITDFAAVLAQTKTIADQLKQLKDQIDTV